jgi:hypothetical protein
MNHQFSLFGWQRPQKKIPLSAERIKEVRDLIAAGDKKAAIKMRELREGLEQIERRISHGKL